MANITTQTIRVDLSTGKVIPTAYTHQNDTARTLVFDMYNGGLPYTMTGNTVKFAYKSPVVNGQYSVITGSGMASGTVGGNKVSVTLPVAYTAISGVGLLTMIITPSSGTIRPVNIRLVVQKSADGANEIAGASDFPDAWMDEKVYSWLDDHIDGIFTEEQFNGAIETWLDDHPEATTTVEDGSITERKLNSTFRAELETNHPDCEIHAPYKLGEQGDCTVLKCGDELILIDFGGANSASTVETYLVNNSLTHFTRCIVTHFHPDHVGGAETILGSERLDFSDCVFYLPPLVDYTLTTETSTYESRDTATRTLIEGLGNTVVIPENNTVTAFGHLSCRWLNCDTEAWENAGLYDELLSGSTDMNNFCVVCEFTHGNIVFLSPSDLAPLGQSLVAPYITRVDIYKAEHHGVNEDANNDYLSKINPSLTIVEGIGFVSHFNLNPISRHLQDVRSCVLAEQIGNEDTVIVSNGFEASFTRGGGNAFNSSVPFLYSITSMNDVTTTGLYRVHGVSIENVQRSDVYGYLLHAEYGSYATQFLTTQAGYAAVRGYNGSMWSAWRRLTNHTLSIAANDDLNDYTTLGSYASENSSRTSTLANCPVTGSGFVLEVRQGQSDAWIVQQITQTTTSKCALYYRAVRVDGTQSFGTWYKIEGTTVE